jgi:uncharacterized protein YceH (UPF0502 family)
VLVSHQPRRAAQCRHVTKIPSPQILYFLHLQTRDARNPFRFRSYENCQVTSFQPKVFLKIGDPDLAGSEATPQLRSAAPACPVPAGDHVGIEDTDPVGAARSCFKSFTCNTYASPRKCCKQKTYGKTKPFRCNTYKNTGYLPQAKWLSLSSRFPTFAPSDAQTLFSIPTSSFPKSSSVVSFHPVNILLNEVECRVLGALIEKEITTPEYYPLSLNALVNACNQKSNRDPVMNLDEAAVREALHSLDGQSLVRSVSASDSRVTKYEHRLQEAFNFYRHEIAILCVLLLRGPQTPGELRTRAERMHPFDDLSAVQSSLQHLMKREPPLVKVLPRQPGTKEARYAHLLAGDIEAFEPKPEADASAASNSADAERLALLEKEVAALRQNASALEKELTDLRQQFAQFRKQFE